MLRTGGVKVLWGIQGSGKTSTVTQTLAQLQQDGRIAASIHLTPPDKAGLAADWLRSSLADWRGQILRENERLRDLLPRGNKPYVIVLDQMENQVTDEALRVKVATAAVEIELVLYPSPTTKRN